MSDVFTVSPDGKRIAFVKDHEICVYSVDEKNVTSTCPYPEFMTIHFMKWTDNSNCYLATSVGIVRYSPENEKMEALDMWRSEIVPEHICDIQVDEPTGNYIICCKQNKVGGVQYGVFNQSNAAYLPGRAAALYRVNNAYFKNELLRTIIHQNPEDPTEYLMKTDCLTKPSLLAMREAGMNYSNPATGEYPVSLTPDPMRCGGYVVAGRKIHYFDLLNGLRVFSTGLSSNAICAICAESNGHAVVINEHEKNVARVSIDYHKFVVEDYAGRSDHLKLHALHFAIRCGMRDTQDEDMQKLVNVLYSNKVDKAQAVVRVILNKMDSIPDKEKAIKSVGSRSGLQKMISVLYDIWAENENFNWMWHFENWIRKYMNWPLLSNQEESEEEEEEEEENERMGRNQSRKVDTSEKALAKEFVDSVIDVDSEEGKAIMKELIHNPFERIKKARAVKKLADTMMKKEYEELAKQMKQHACVLPGNEFWNGILEEVYADEEKRAQADRELRKYFFKN